MPALAGLATENRTEAYNLPQGVITHRYRDIAAGKPGSPGRVRMKPLVDPRLDGGRINDATTEERVRLMESAGAEYLFYPSMKIDVAFLHGTTFRVAGRRGAVCR